MDGEAAGWPESRTRVGSEFAMHERDRSPVHGVEGQGGCALEGVTAAVAAWEEIESGRFQPRRIRGSLPGRELG